jgi:hypothetical protein
MNMHSSNLDREAASDISASPRRELPAPMPEKLPGCPVSGDASCVAEQNITEGRCADRRSALATKLDALSVFAAQQRFRLERRHERGLYRRMRLRRDPL